MKRILALVLISSASVFAMQSENKQVQLQKDLKQTERQYFVAKVGFNTATELCTPMYLIRPELTLGMMAFEGAKFGVNAAIDYYFINKTIEINKQNNNK